MPTNVTIHYLKAEEEYHEAKNDRERLKALHKMLATLPKHKGTEKLRKNITERIRKLKIKISNEKKSGKGKSFSIPKEGASQVVLIGLPNSGKSTLLSKLSGRPVEIADYPFTTKEPEVRMIPYEDVWIQAIELPAIYSGVLETKQGPSLFGLIRNADFIILVLKSEKDEKELKEELRKAGILLGDRKERKGLDLVMPYMKVFWKDFEDKKLPEKIWKHLHKIRVYTRVRGKKASKPLILREGATVQDVAKEVHKDFLKKFKYAKIWGKSAKFPGQQVGLEHKLLDGDEVEIFTH